MLKPVRYADRPVEEIFPELVHGLADTLRQFIHGIKVPEMTVPQFLDGSTLLKGQRTKRNARFVSLLCRVQQRWPSMRPRNIRKSLMRRCRCRKSDTAPKAGSVSSRSSMVSAFAYRLSALSWARALGKTSAPNVLARYWATSPSRCHVANCRSRDRGQPLPDRSIRRPTQPERDARHRMHKKAGLLPRVIHLPNVICAASPAGARTL